MTCEDMAQRLGTDAYEPEPECPPDATCAACEHCDFTHDTNDPFSWLADEELRERLRTFCGLCVEDAEEVCVVMLDTTRRDMPCGGDYWRPR